MAAQRGVLPGSSEGVEIVSGDVTKFETIPEAMAGWYGEWGCETQLCLTFWRWLLPMASALHVGPALRMSVLRRELVRRLATKLQCTTLHPC